MFNKALFKQSCKANGMMWGIISFAVCFMLACVMLISGNGNIGEVKNSIQDTIIVKEVDAQMEKRALFYYSNANDGLKEFDTLFSQNASETISYLLWYSNIPDETNYANKNEYYQALVNWKQQKPEMSTEAGKDFDTNVSSWEQKTPNISDYSSTEEYLNALLQWKGETPLTQENAIQFAYSNALKDLQKNIIETAKESGYEENSTETQEMLGSVLYVINPNGTFNNFYLKNNESIPEDYDVLQLITHISSQDINAYLISEERSNYRQQRSLEGSAIFLSGNMTQEENIEALMNALSTYGVTKEKYESFNYTYDSIKHLAKTSIVTYQGRLTYELELLNEKYIKGEFENEQTYLEAVNAKKKELSDDISSSFLSTLPDTVSDALEEIGKADLYTLVVGSIFYKLAGLLLPIIYMIMASNNLISGQVDSGSMAYILSTSTKRKTVVFTQALYLIGSLFAMFSLTTITSCICLSLVSEEVGLTYGKLILLNVGAFLVLFALSGLCFFTSCIFDRSKRSMAIGGGLSIFALVAAMLGLFGSPVIPSVVRLNALNNFNYTTIISLFDVISIIDGTNIFLYKFIILAILGIIGYILGSMRFIKKDLPL